MNSKKIGVSSGIVSILVFVLQFGPSLLLNRLADQEYEGVPLLLGTIGRTHTTYALLIGIVEGVLVIGLSFGLGYYVARRIDIATEFKRFVKAIGLGSGLGLLLGGPVLGLVLFELLGPGEGLILGFVLFELLGPGELSFSGFMIFMTVAGFIRLLVDVALFVTIGAIAGAAIVVFRTDDKGQGSPAEANDSPSPSSAEPSREDSQPKSTSI